jgi:opacity protein-like surface antigen
MLARSRAAALLLLLLLLALPAVVARAEEGAEEDPYSEPGIYGAFGGTFAWQLFEDDLDTPALPVTVNNSMGVEIRLGYRAHPYVAGEVAIDVLDGFNGEVGTQNTSIDLLAGTFNLKGYLPAGRLQPYLAAGLGYMSVDSGNEALTDDGTDLVARFGSGLDVYVTDNFSVYAGWHYLLPFGDIQDFDLLAIHFGIQYMLRFQEP